MVKKKTVKTTKKTAKKAPAHAKKEEAKVVIAEEKPIVKIVPAVEKPKALDASKYFYGLGKRKCAIAQVRIYPKGKGDIKINGKDLNKYFPSIEFQNTVKSPLKLAGQESIVDISVIVHGGGTRGQADSIRHGIARALLAMDAEYRKTLKKAGFLTRDSRVKERKKPGLKRARRAPQWAKR
jgi:small subunit ribosomal protein S9